MFIRLFFFLASISPVFQEKLWQWWYQRLAAGYKKMDWRFMNYGYEPNLEEQKISLTNEGDKENRLSIQLYHHTLKSTDLSEKDVLEVGSGRGGGADFVARYLSPRSIIGVDFAKNAVKLCNENYRVPHLRFVEGNAERLPFEEGCFDVVYNIESSHCYGNMGDFVDEVARVLKPGGVFAWADVRTKNDVKKINQIFESSSLSILTKENITLNVLEALNQVSDSRKEVIQKHVPYFWQRIFSEFAGVRDSQIYRGFQEGEMEYWHYLLKKPKT